MMNAPDAVRRYFECINGDRFEELRGVFAPEVLLQMAGAKARRGVDATIAYYPLALAPLPHHVDDPVSVVCSDDRRRVAVEIAFTGTTTGGQSVEFTAVDLFDLDDDGRVARLRSFYDTAGVARQLQAE